MISSVVRFMVSFTVVFGPSMGQAYSNFYEYNESQPASVSATLESNCKEAFKIFEKDISKYLVKAPFVASAETISQGKWKEDSKSSTSISHSRQNIVSLSTTSPKDFPPTLFSLSSTKTLCQSSEKGSSSESSSECYDSYALNLNGKNANLYQKVLELGNTGNPFQSFTLSFTFNDNSDNKCSFYSSISIADSHYLISRPHLTKNLDPTHIESAILKGFTGWIKVHLNALEGNS